MSFALLKLHPATLSYPRVGDRARSGLAAGAVIFNDQFGVAGNGGEQAPRQREQSAGRLLIAALAREASAFPRAFQQDI